MKRLLIALPTLLLCISAQALVDVDLSRQTTAAEDFAMALAAARDNHWPRLDKLEKNLGRHHPLQGYLDFHRLRAELPNASPGQVRAWQRRYAELPLAQSIENIALSRYGNAGNWAAIRELRDQPPYHLELQCHWWRAEYEVNPEEALESARAIWLSGQSRPTSCDPLFALARAGGVIDDAVVLARIELAFRADNPGLMRYLHGLLAEDNQRTSEWLQRLHQQPARVLQLPGDLSEQQRDTLISAALYRMADRDTGAALTLLENAERHGLQISEASRSEIQQRIAWFSTIRDLPGNRRWLNNWLALNSDTELLEQRIRRAVIEQHWSDVSAWIARLPSQAQASARWQYWLGRAWQEQGEDALSQEAWQQAAGQRSFWGYLAADQLGLPYAMNASATPESFGPPDHPALQRITLLRDAGEPALAMNEWRRLIRNSDAQSVSELNAHALRAGWYELTVEGALQTDQMDALAWRFPAAYRDSFFRQAEALDSDPWLMMAVARRESAFNPQAVSPVGALGLMQVMPGTAQQVSRWLGNGAPSRDALLDVETSISLGGTYLATLLERYQGNRLLALAAYNAGPHRVDGWLDNHASQDKPFDVWIESIPFRETRDYVQAVLIYRTLLVSLADGTDEDNEQRIPMMLDQEQRVSYDLALKPTQPMEQTGLELAQR